MERRGGEGREREEGKEGAGCTSHLPCQCECCEDDFPLGSFSIRSVYQILHLHFLNFQLFK